MSKSHAVSGAILIWVICAATKAMVISGTELWQRSMPESIDLFQRGFVMMFMKQQDSQKIMSAEIQGLC